MPLCFDEDVLLKSCEFDRTDELFGWRLAGFVAFAMRLFEARERLLSIMVKFELPVALIEELTFSGWLKLLELYLDDLLRESEVMGSCPIAD